MKVYRLDSKFPYDELLPSAPRALQGGGAFYSSLHIKDVPIKLQLPECSTKSGIVSCKRGGYCDLVYDVDKHSALIDSLEKLEATICSLVSGKKELWFTNDVSDEDIESMNVPITRSYKSGKSFTIRIQIGRSRMGGNIPFIYDEVGAALPHDSTDLAVRRIIPLISLDGLKYTSRSITTDLSAVQFMLLDKEIIKNCIINTDHESISEVSVPEEENKGPSHPAIAVSKDKETTETMVRQELPVEKEDCRSENAILDASEDTLREVNVFPNDSDTISIRNQADVYRELYAEAYQKATRLREAAIKAYAKAHEIKALFDFEDSNETEMNAPAV